MSDLREQLERAKREHEDVRYPGDLGAEVLGVRSMRLGYATTPRRTWLLWANVGALGAVAATIALVMFRTTQTAVVMNPTEGQPTAVVAMQPRGADDFSVVPELAGGTLVPQGGEIMPASETAVTVPAMPSFPSMSDVMNSATTTNNQENNT